MGELPQDQKDLLTALSTPGLCETVPFHVKVKVARRGWRFILPPLGWAINYEEPWELTDKGILATMEPGEIEKFNAEIDCLERGETQ